MLLSEPLTLMAASVVERLFPPAGLTDTYQVVVSLNLLNASVKQKWGKRVTSYAYLKGMAACLFLWLLYHPIEGVRIFWDAAGKIAYFHLCGRQFSFHYVPLLHRYRQKMQEAALTPLSWDGIQRQLIAADLFCEATGYQPAEDAHDDSQTAKADRPDADAQRATELRQFMVDFGRRDLNERVKQLSGVPFEAGDERPRIHTETTGAAEGQTVSANRRATRRKSAKYPKLCTDKRRCLEVALKFDPFGTSQFELRRPSDHWKMRVARYTGFNLKTIADFIADNRPPECRIPGLSLVAGQHYFLQRSTWQWRNLTRSRCLLLIGHYNYLAKKNTLYNLCITYQMACYLGAQFPRLRFMNVLNYSRLTVHRRLYTLHALLTLPRGSKARVLKVWIIVDQYRELSDYDIRSMPAPLYREYCQAADYRHPFSIVRKKGRTGLIAYSRFHLLPPIYRKIKIYGHYAQVTNVRGKIAVYSLLREEFDSDFIYDRVWWDEHRHSVMGRCGDIEVLIQDIFSERKQSWEWGIRINSRWRQQVQSRG